MAGRPASWERLERGEEGEGSGLSRCGYVLGTKGEVLSEREQLSGSEVVWRLEGGIILAGPGVDTGVEPAAEETGPEPEVDCVSSHTELCDDSSPSDMQGEAASRDSTEGMEKEAQSYEPSPFCFIAFLCSVVLK